MNRNFHFQKRWLLLHMSIQNYRWVWVTKSTISAIFLYFLINYCVYPSYMSPKFQIENKKDLIIHFGIFVGLPLVDSWLALRSSKCSVSSFSSISIGSGSSDPDCECDGPGSSARRLFFLWFWVFWLLGSRGVVINSSAIRSRLPARSKPSLLVASIPSSISSSLSLSPSSIRNTWAAWLWLLSLDLKKRMFSRCFK